MHLVTHLTARSSDINALHTEGTLYYEATRFIPVNTHVIFDAEDSNKKTMARYEGDHLWTPIGKDLSVGKMRPKDANQSSFVSHLNDPNILLAVAVGPAGTGKTSLALSYAIDRHLADRKGMSIKLSKPLSRVGSSDAIATLPGTLEEKMGPYMGSYETVLRKVAPDKGYVELMMRNHDLEYIPLEFTRGQTFENCVFILDEAQNVSWHELNTLISRMGQNSKLIILGDLQQIDTGERAENTGLYKLISSAPFLDSGLSSVVELKTQYRSPLCNLAVEVNTWINTKARKKPETKSSKN